jgi:uncharacterized protein YuzE
MVKGELESLRITLEAAETGVLGYVYLQEIEDGDVARTVEVCPAVMADYDRGGRLLGIEFLHAELADGALMRELARRLNHPELSGIDLAEMCRTAA